MSGFADRAVSADQASIASTDTPFVRYRTKRDNPRRLLMIRNFTAEDVTDQSGRTFFVTGANSGIGLETARVLAAKGARVLLGCRTEAKALSAMADIRLEHPNADLGFVPLDLADLGSVRGAAAKVKAEERIDVLVNNAGVMVPPLGRTKDGFELQFGVNHLGTFALTGLLLDQLFARPYARIVITSSIAHRSGEIDFDDIDAQADYNRLKRYRMSKLANLLHMYELDRRLRDAKADAIALACHPGVAATNLMRFLPGPAKLLMMPGRLLLNSAAEGAWPTLAAATSPKLDGGAYVGPSKRGETAGPAAIAKSAERARNSEIAERLWAVSEEKTGVEYRFA
ncbi:putative oxidoreductase protein [Fulvimarina pelagi HTCC2506]|uniref:Putative oxidoreductase protein n=2 Tax=Fulvimarina pelagi TaxID=217511 RepID=Q0G6Q2_9HYPH|nr:putative oxidoreductase protein [Fulvimarina pelagi HTCC2506]